MQFLKYSSLFIVLVFSFIGMKYNRTQSTSSNSHPVSEKRHEMYGKYRYESIGPDGQYSGIVHSNTRGFRISKNGFCKLKVTGHFDDNEEGTELTCVHNNISSQVLASNSAPYCGSAKVKVPHLATDGGGFSIKIYLEDYQQDCP